MRELKTAGILSAALVLGTLAGDPAQSQQSAPVASEPMPAAEVDPNAFGFSVSDFAASLGVKLRGLLGTRSAIDQVDEIVDPAALEYNYYRPVLDTLSAWTANSSFSGLVRVNQPLKAGFVNFFILNHNHLAAKAPHLACNCSYVPESWSIVCDGLFLANAQRLLESKPAPDTPPPTADKNDDAKKNNDDKGRAELELQIQGMFRSFLFEWMIAHELGHLLHNHTAKDLARSWNYSNGIPIGLAAEKEADEFYISRMQHNQQRQFGAWLGLSNVVTRLYTQAVRAQHRPEEIQEQISKNGPRFIYSTELGIDVRYVADKHPPLLVRALNLANLVIARYPQMYDSTGYFDRVRDRINPIQSTVPDSPELCLTNNTTTDEDSSEEQVLAKHLDILLTQAAPPEWTRATIEKLRKRVSEQKEPAVLTLSSRATDLGEALAEPDPVKARSRIEAVETANDEGLPEAFRVTLRLLSLATRARAGLLPEAMSVADAVKQGEAHLNDLIRAGGLDLSKPSQKMDALRLLLQIGLARGKTRDEKTEGLLNYIVEDLLQLQDLAAIDKHMLLQILEADYSRTSQESGARDNTLQRANSAMRVAALADRNGWTLIEVNYLASQLVLLERIKPKPLDDLMAGFSGLGRQLQFAGYTQAAPAMFQRAIDHADAALASNERGADDKKEIAGRRLRYLNNLGWSFLILRKFSDALVPLNAAREGRVAERADRQHCDKSHDSDIELASVNQNLADVSLALGKFADAASYAHEARQCRIELDIKNKIIESTKTEGYALIYSGKQSEGMALVKEYSSAIRQFLDDDVLPKDDPFISGAIVDGKFVPLEQFVQFADKNRPVRTLPLEPASEMPKENQ